MKKLIISGIALIFMSFAGTSTVYVSKSSKISFFSETSLENIDATNIASTSALNTSTSSIYFKIPIKNFKFKNSLMQEHFNQDYMESDKFPTSTFKGTISSKIDYTKDGSTKVNVTGTMTIHGVSKAITTTGMVTVKGGVISVSSQFNVLLKDYNVKVPTLLTKKIAENIKVTLQTTYEPSK